MVRGCKRGLLGRWRLRRLASVSAPKTVEVYSMGGGLLRGGIKRGSLASGIVVPTTRGSTPMGSDMEETDAEAAMEATSRGMGSGSSPSKRCSGGTTIDAGALCWEPAPSAPAVPFLTRVGSEEGS